VSTRLTLVNRSVNFSNRRPARTSSRSKRPAFEGAPEGPVRGAPARHPCPQAPGQRVARPLRRGFRPGRLRGLVQILRGQRGQIGKTTVTRCRHLRNLSPLTAGTNPKPAGTAGTTHSGHVQGRSPLGLVWCLVRLIRCFAARRQPRATAPNGGPARLRRVTDQARRSRAGCGSSGSIQGRASGVCSRRRGPCRESGSHAPTARGKPRHGRSLGRLRT
jgi:hypothetical protein